MARLAKVLAVVGGVSAVLLPAAAYSDVTARPSVAARRARPLTRRDPAQRKLERKLMLLSPSRRPVP